MSVLGGEEGGVKYIYTCTKSLNKGIQEFEVTIPQALIYMPAHVRVQHKITKCTWHRRWC